MKTLNEKAKDWLKMKPLYKVTTSAGESIVCAQCADEIKHITRCQFGQFRDFKCSQYPEQMGTCPNCEMRKARDKAFDPER